MKKKLIVAILSICAMMLAVACNPTPPVLSTDASLTVTSVGGHTVDNCGITLTTAEWNVFSAITDYKQASVYTLAEKATLSVTREDKVLTFVATAEDGATTNTITVTVTVLSNDTALSISTVAGVAVNANTVTLTTAQWNALSSASDLEAQCEYTLANNASVAVALDGTSLTFAVTAQDGTTASQTVAITVLSNDTTLTLHKIGEKQASAGKFVLTAEEWLELKNTANLNPLLTVSHHEAASYSAIFDAVTSKLLFTVTAEDGTVANTEVAVAVEDVFGRFGEGALGSEDGYVWSNTAGAYVTASGTNGDSAYYVTPTQTLKNTFAFSAEITFPALIKEGEIVMCAQVRPNKVIRFAVRATSTTQIRVFSDYRDDTAFLNDTTHVAAHDYTGAIRMGIVVYGNDVAMIWNGETVYHRALDGIDASEFKLNGAYNMVCELRDIVAIDDEDTVASMYAQAMKDYHDPVVGYTTGTTCGLDLFTQDKGKGTVSVLYDKTALTGYNRTDPIVAFYENGNTLVGYSWAVEGTIKTKQTASVGKASMHLGFWAYQDNNNWARFLVNRSSTNSGATNIYGVYFYYKENGKDAYKSTLVTAKNALTSGAEWSTDMTLAFNAGEFSIFLEGKKQFSYKTNLRVTNAMIEPMQYVDCTLSSLSLTHDVLEVERICNELEKLSAPASPFADNTVFTTEGQSFVKTSMLSQSSALKVGGSLDAQTTAYFTARFGVLTPCVRGGWADVTVLNEAKSGLRVAVEYCDNGEYRTVVQSIVSSVYAPAIQLGRGANREIDLAIVVRNGVVTVAMSGVAKYEYALSGGVQFSMGGQNAVARVKNYVSAVTSSEVDAFYNGLREDVYVSGFEGEVTAIEAMYEGAAQGQLLLAGSSSIRNWRTMTAQNAQGESVARYLVDLASYTDANADGAPDVINVGFGGSTYKDWIVYYERLVKAYAPSEMVLYCGANDVYQTYSAQTAYADFITFISLVRADFPTMKIHYVHIMPTNNMKKQGVWEQVVILKDMMEAYAKTDANFVTIDIENSLINPDGSPNMAYFIDNGHLNAAGYEIWSAAIRKSLGV